MSKTNHHDDADGGSGNSNDDGGVDENGVFDVKCGDEADDGNEQTKSVAGNLIKYNESSKMGIRMGLMRWRILKETRR